MTFNVIITSNIHMPISQLSFSFHLQPLILVTAVLWVIKPLGYSVNLWVEVCRWDTEAVSGLCVFFLVFFFYCIALFTILITSTVFLQQQYLLYLRNYNSNDSSQQSAQTRHESRALYASELYLTAEQERTLSQIELFVHWPKSL